MLFSDLIRKTSVMTRLKPLLFTIVLGLGACGGGGGGGGTSAPTVSSFSGPEGVLYSFGSTKQTYFDGAYPGYGHFILASDGNYYGLTTSGGNAGLGTVIKIVPGSGQTSVVWSFGGIDSTGKTDGTTPVGSLVQDGNGNFYGMTGSGGANGNGTVFELTSAGVETVLWSFGGKDSAGKTDGASPYGNGSLIQYNGNFYGMTEFGGANSKGTVFELTPGTTPTETVLWSFGGTGDGQYPQGSLIQYNGNFYGMTHNGGVNGYGTMFELTPGTTPTETVLWSFGGAGDGQSPTGSLIQYNGNFYGMTVSGGTNSKGTVFELTPGTTPMETVLWSFGGTGDGATPSSSLIQDSSGNFYGTTYRGGANGYGTVFELTPGTTPSETVLWSFGGTDSTGNTDGQLPESTLIQDSYGNFYGMTYNGGANQQGIVFSLNPTTQQEAVLHSFTGGGGDADTPSANLVQDSNGNFYGMTESGGANNSGTVFELTPKGTEKVLWSFGGTDSTGKTDGAQPYGNLIQDSQGNFYGMTYSGGANYKGIVFELTPGTTPTERVLWSFGGIDSTGNTDGTSPSGSLVRDNQGNFYGKTEYGGANNKGVVFVLTPSGTETVLWSFGGTDSAGKTDGASPYGNGGLIQYNGNFYGMTYGGGVNSNGTVFELTVNGTSVTEKVLWSFGGNDSAGNVDGKAPQGNLIQYNGNFYGTTPVGGSYGTGTVFELTPSTTTTEKVLWSFGGTGDGINPVGLIQDNQGNFYGMTNGGGAYGNGTVFELTLGATPSETVLWSFGGTGDGSQPNGSLIQGSDGNFYGMTSTGGAFALGTVVGIKHP